VNPEVVIDCLAEELAHSYEVVSDNRDQVNLLGLVLADKHFLEVLKSLDKQLTELEQEEQLRTVV
jgi:hypothetical protein